MPTLTAPAPSAKTAPAAVTDGFVDRFGTRCYRIAHADRLPVFFMNIVSPSDLWLFVASNGALSAGRGDSDRALFPYQTVDRIYDSAGQTGPCTLLRVARAGGRPVLWEPFSAHGPRIHRVDRHLYKSVEGDRVWFEEINHDLGLTFTHGWATAEDHGFVREATLTNLAASSARIQLLDGLRNLLVPGVTRRLQNEYSCLADAYKSADRVEGTTLALYSLASGIVDRAIPMESLRATAVWSDGLPGAAVHLSEHAYATFLADGDLSAPAPRRGVRATYALSTELTLAPEAQTAWTLVADIGLDQARAAALADGLRDRPGVEAVEAAVADSTRRLRALVGSSDGLQAGGDETATAHHFANTLFNIMRGGVSVDNHTVFTADFADFLRVRNRAAAGRHAAWLAALPATLPHAAFIARVQAAADPDLVRIGREYLPFTFSRRHGDPSRPWNKFNIRVRDEQGARVLNHEGNWRDIFQNWEALCLSFPAFLESIVSKFVNASTADGYNPYRITRAGIEWEVPEPEDPWASIGYWGDHQTIYLQKLLEWSARFHPGVIAAWLREPAFAYADVPYRISNYNEIRRRPRDTIAFDAAAHEAIMARVSAGGTDGKLVHGPDDRVLHVNLAEKLLLLALVRLVNLVPGGGIWMNTQRPEWNDANNALVGNGLSVVTLAYLRRFLAHFQRELLPALGAEPVAISSGVAALLRAVAGILADHAPALTEGAIGDTVRRRVTDLLGAAGSDHRDTLHSSGPGAPALVEPAAIAAFVRDALAVVDHSLRLNRREDGLWHAYNLLAFSEQPAALAVHHLAPMLEGQVAILSAGLLAPAEAADLLAALRASPLYRADQHSYLLYPDKQLPDFLDRNRVPAELAAANPLIDTLLQAGDTRLVLRDATGQVRFHPDLANDDELVARLDALAADPAWSGPVATHRESVRAVYEATFNHRAFTGRSGSMFGYEGLGSIYWHMVSKLLLATQENLLAAREAGDPAADRLETAYFDIRSGLGPAKTPAVYGAFPTDPYSHTPGHAGAQQPGMTGQVNEELLTRLGELGVRIANGRVRFHPDHLPEGEFTEAPIPFRHVTPDGQAAVRQLPPGALGFTFAGTPVVYRQAAGEPMIHVRMQDGSERSLTGDTLDAATSRALFERDGSIREIEVLLAGR
ncbi:MAG: hypothetical protein ABII82_16015 [Verrucomicrobiota bacterium]